MIYGQDEPVALPVMDLYDTGMMQMYVNAARDQYLQAREDQKEFLKTYGDFLSPIQNDMNYWYNNTINPVNKMMNEAAERGIDLTRSTEGRALLARTLNNLPYAELAKVRQSAKDADQYLKNRAELESKGLWSPEYENWILKQEGLPNFENWDSTKNGVWNRISPAAYQDLNSATKHWYDQLKDSYIETKDGYDWFGVTKGDLEKTTASNLSDFVGGNLGKFFLEKAKQELMREGNANPTVAQQLDRLKSNIVVANKELTHRNRDANIYDKMQKDYEYDMKKLGAQWQHDRNMATLKHNLTMREIAAEKETPQQVMPIGSWEQLRNTQNNNYRNKALGYIQKYKSDQWNKQKAAYINLSPADKKFAVNYGKAYRILYGGQKATANQKKWASGIIAIGNKSVDNKFKTWRTHFLNRQKSNDLIWSEYSTTEGNTGGAPMSESQLRSKSYRIFNELNTVTGLSDENRKTLDSRLQQVYDPKSKMYISSVKNNSDFADITVAAMTGNRMYRRYRGNSRDKLGARKISDLIRGKSYAVSSKSRSARKYASGEINKKAVDVIIDYGQFTDPSIKKELNKWTVGSLKKYGITRNMKTVEKDGKKVQEVHSYTIPVATRFNQDFGEATAHVSEDERIYGKTVANKYAPTRQAHTIDLE